MEGPNGDFVVGMSNEDNQTLKRFPPLDPLSSRKDTKRLMARRRIPKIPFPLKLTTDRIDDLKGKAEAKRNKRLTESSPIP